MRAGAHLSISHGLARTVEEAVRLGCDTLQIFSGNPRGWRRKIINPAEAEEFRLLCGRRGLDPVVVHTPYLINLAAVDQETFRKSLRAFAEDLERARLLGAGLFVTHMGYHRGEGMSAGIKKMARSLGELLKDRPPGGPRVLLENTATAGSSLGHSFPVIGEVMEKSGVADRLYLCLDTCHAFVAGYDVASAAGLDRALAEIGEFIGLEKLKLVHFNDSRFGLASGLDRHHHLGRGKIGLSGLRRIVRHRSLRSLPFIIETPKETPDADSRNLKVLRSLAKGKVRSRGPARKDAKRKAHRA